jgi:hypothetical protein
MRFTQPKRSRQPFTKGTLPCPQLFLSGWVLLQYQEGGSKQNAAGGTQAGVPWVKGPDRTNATSQRRLQRMPKRPKLIQPLSALQNALQSLFVSYASRLPSGYWSDSTPVANARREIARIHDSAAVAANPRTINDTLIAFRKSSTVAGRRELKYICLGLTTIIHGRWMIARTLSLLRSSFDKLKPNLIELAESACFRHSYLPIGNSRNTPRIYRLPH